MAHNPNTSPQTASERRGRRLIRRASEAGGCCIAACDVRFLQMSCQIVRFSDIRYVMPNMLSDIQSFRIYLLSVPVLALVYVLLWVLVSALMSVLILEPDTDCVQDCRRRIATSNVLMFL